jgi:hypothetical protein
MPNIRNIISGHNNSVVNKLTSTDARNQDNAIAGTSPHVHCPVISGGASLLKVGGFSRFFEI